MTNTFAPVDKSGCTSYAARAIRRRAEPTPDGRRCDAGRPDDGGAFQALAAEPDAAGVAARDGGAHAHLDAELLERAQRVSRLRLLERREHARPGLDEHDLRAARIDAAEVCGERETRELRDRARELDARRACADDHEAQQPLAPRGVRLHLGGFERAQDPAADRRRVVDRFQARRVGLPVVVAEVRMRGARRDDEVVVRQRALAELRRRSVSNRRP